MIGKQIYIARQLLGISMDELTQRMNGALTKMAISKYERGLINPSPDNLEKIAAALALPLDFFHRPPLKISRKFFRQDRGMTAEEIQQITSTVMEQVELFCAAEQLAAHAPTFRNPFRTRTVRTIREAEAAADKLRTLWHIGTQPIVSVYELLEMHGIHVVEVSIKDTRIDGMSLFIEGYIPFIIINTEKNATTERKRFTALHELAHLLLRIAPAAVHQSGHTPDTSIADTVERMAHTFAGAMLFPRECAEFRLGTHRDSLHIDELISIRNLYGISIAAAVHRAHDINIITRACYNDMFDNHINTNRMETGWGAYPIKETADRYKRLVRRLVLK